MESDSHSSFVVIVEQMQVRRLLCDYVILINLSFILFFTCKHVLKRACTAYACVKLPLTGGSMYLCTEEGNGATTVKTTKLSEERTIVL